MRLERGKALEFSQQDFILALKDYKPASLVGVQLHTSNTQWSDIGGEYEFYFDQ
jgi:SpoVK/Ycf46/Vps4 family AAA+-type ATPase